MAVLVASAFFLEKSEKNLAAVTVGVCQNFRIHAKDIRQRALCDTKRSVRGQAEETQRSAVQGLGADASRC